MKYYNLEDYNYDIKPSKVMMEVVKNDGLITPLVIKDGELFKKHREKFMAFKIAANEMPNATKVFIAVDWDSLNDFEKNDL